MRGCNSRRRLHAPVATLRCMASKGRSGACPVPGRSEWFKAKDNFIRGCSSAVERFLAKEEAVGANPITRSTRASAVRPPRACFACQHAAFGPGCSRWVAPVRVHSIRRRGCAKSCPHGCGTQERSDEYASVWKARLRTESGAFRACTKTELDVRNELVPEVGLEPTNPYGWEILSLLRIPFRHSGLAQSYRNYKTGASCASWVALTVKSPPSLASRPTALHRHESSSKCLRGSSRNARTCDPARRTLCHRTSRGCEFSYQTARRSSQ